MIPSALPIHARILGTDDRALRERRAVVEKLIDSETVVIRTGGGRTTLRLSGGSLHEGQEVRLLQSGDRLLLSPIAAEPRSAQHLPDSVGIGTETAERMLPRIGKLIADSTRLLSGKTLIEQIQRAVAVQPAGGGPTMESLAKQADAIARILAEPNRRVIPPAEGQADTVVRLLTALTAELEARSVSAGTPSADHQGSSMPPHIPPTDPPSVSGVAGGAAPIVPTPSPEEMLLRAGLTGRDPHILLQLGEAEQMVPPVTVAVDISALAVSLRDEADRLLSSEDRPAASLRLLEIARLLQGIGRSDSLFAAVGDAANELRETLERVRGARGEGTTQDWEEIGAQVRVLADRLQDTADAVGQEAVGGKPAEDAAPARVVVLSTGEVPPAVRDRIGMIADLLGGSVETYDARSVAQLNSGVPSAAETPFSGAEIADVGSVHGRGEETAARWAEWSQTLRELTESLLAIPLEKDFIVELLDVVEILRQSAAGDTEDLQDAVRRLRELLAQLVAPQAGVSTHVVEAARESLEVLSLIGSGSGEAVLPAAPIHLDTLPEPGLYRFENVDRAMLWLAGFRNDAQPPTPAGSTVEAFVDNKVYMRVSPLSLPAETPAVELLSRQRLLVEMQHMVRLEMQSAAMRGIPGDILAAALDRHGFVPEKLLRTLDELFYAYEQKSGAEGSVLSGRAAGITMSQIIASALEAPTAIPILLAAGRDRAAAELPALVEALGRMLEGREPALRLPPGVVYGLTEGMMQSGPARHELLPSLFRALGYDFEALLAGTASTGGKASGELDGLKQVLLSLSAQLAVHRSAESAGESSGRADAGDDQSEGGGEEGTEGSAARMGTRITLEQAARHAEGALTRLESLQMLARPVQLADSSQQVLALPMRINDEWTEVRVRFVKQRREGKQKGRDERFGVTLAVRPSALGEIAVQMDYRRTGGLTVRISFERAAVRRWFMSRNRDLVDALRSLGAGSVQVQLGRLESRGESILSTETKPGGEGHSGAVDVWG